MDVEPSAMSTAADAVQPPALLQYQLAPSSVDYSAGPDALSVVTLTLSATNPTAAPIICSLLTFEMPCGAGPDALTVDPSTIDAAPGSQTPWVIWGSRLGSWYAVPLPPATSIDPGATVEFVLANVVVNETQSPRVVFAIEERTDTLRIGSASLAKASAVSPGKRAPRIESFTAVPAHLPLGGTATLAWKVVDAGSCVIAPGGISLPDPASGTLSLTVRETTLFTLRAVGSGGVASESAVVEVQPVAVDSFTAVPATVAPGEPVTLSWETAFAAACSIDQGIGSVATSGSIVVYPQLLTTYTLTAEGRDPVTRAVTVDVTAT